MVRDLTGRARRGSRAAARLEPLSGWVRYPTYQALTNWRKAEMDDPEDYPEEGGHMSRHGRIVRTPHADRPSKAISDSWPVRRKLNARS